MAPAIISSSFAQPDQMLITGIFLVSSVCSLLLTVVICACCSAADKTQVKEVPSERNPEPVAVQQQVPVEPSPVTPISKSTESTGSALKQSAPAMRETEPETLPSIDQAAPLQLMSFRDQSIGLLPGKMADMPSLQLMDEQPWHSQRAKEAAQAPSADQDRSVIVGSHPSPSSGQQIPPAKKPDSAGAAEERKSPIKSVSVLAGKTVGQPSESLRSISVVVAAAPGQSTAQTKAKTPAPIPAPAPRLAPASAPATLGKAPKQAKPAPPAPTRPKKKKGSKPSWRAKGTPMGMDADDDLGITSDTDRELNAVDKTTAEGIL